MFFLSKSTPVTTGSRRFPASASYMLLLLAGLLMACQPEANTLPDFTGLVERNAAAVVNISTTQKKEARPQGMDELRQRLPDFFQDFFGAPGEGFNVPMPDEESMGSGFIISEDGYILTNFHVVGNPEKILVRLQDRRELEAELIGRDKRSDLALLKVDADRLPVVDIGSSANLKVGEWVLAIGAPFGFESSVTAGIVSAKGRSLPGENYVPFIQTDVAINPGNSGGPLFNLNGEVVGINSQIISQSGGYMGVSFAIPIDMAMDIVEKLQSGKTVSRGWLGVLIQEVDYDLAQSFELDKPMGALVAEVLPDSPAAQGGIQAGDIIIGFNGEEIPVSSRLPQLVGVAPVGEAARVEVIRNGKRHTLKVTIGELPQDEELALQGREASREADGLGVQVRALTEAQQAETGVPQGVVVTAVTDGPAARAGVRSGDIIVSLNNQPIETISRFRDVVAELPEKGVVPVLINRDGNARFMALKLTPTEN